MADLSGFPCEESPCFGYLVLVLFALCGCFKMILSKKCMLNDKMYGQQVNASHRVSRFAMVF